MTILGVLEPLEDVYFLPSLVAEAGWEVQALFNVYASHQSIGGQGGCPSHMHRPFWRLCRLRFCMCGLEVQKRGWLVGGGGRTSEARLGAALLLCSAGVG